MPAFYKKDIEMVNIAVYNSDDLYRDIADLFPERVVIQTDSIVTDGVVIAFAGDITLSDISDSRSEFILLIDNESQLIDLSNCDYLPLPYSPLFLKHRINRACEKIALKQELAEEKNILRRLEEAGQMGYFVADFKDGQKNRMSDAGYTMLGCEPQDHVPSGESFETFIHPDDLPKLLECREDMISQGFADKEFRVQRRDNGEWFWMLARTTFFDFDENGTPTKTIGIHQDITRIKEQELQIQQILKDDLLFEQKKLGMASLQNINKNDLLSEIRKRLNALAEVTENEVAVKNLINFVDKSIRIDDQWELFKQHFEHVHSGFFERLSDKYPKLTINEKKLCAYFRINLSTKEVATLLNIEIESAKKSRTRLRKKLSLDEKDNLVNFLEAV